MQCFIVTAITKIEKTKTSTYMSNFDVNVDGQTDERTDRNLDSISHPAISRCDKNTIHTAHCSYLSVFYCIQVYENDIQYLFVS